MFPTARRSYFHTTGDPEVSIAEVAGEAALVPPLTDFDELAGSTAVVVTTAPAPAVAVALVEWLRSHPEVTVVDASVTGLGLDDPERPPESRGARRYHLADPALAGPAAFVAALAELEPRECQITLINPVSGFGGEALEELAAQGVARLSGAQPKRPRLLPGILAFDLAPSAAGRRDRLAAQFSRLFPELSVRLQSLDAGVFLGHAAVVQVRCGSRVRVSAVRSLFREGGLVRLARPNERLCPSEAVDHDHVRCADLSCSGEWVSAWVVADGHRIGTVAGVIAAIEAITAS